MGNRALKTGELVKVSHHKNLLDMRVASTLSSYLVGHFSFGIYLGGSMGTMTTYEYNYMKSMSPSRDHRTITMACVLDSKTMMFGWVQRKYLVRAE